MGGLHVAPWSISCVIRNQQDVSKNKKLVYIAIFVDDPRLSQYCSICDLWECILLCCTSSCFINSSQGIPNGYG